MEILIILLIVVGLFFSLRYMKKNKYSCGGSCSGCTASCKHRK